MKIKDIELANISRYRGELMGAAMLFIILFHVALPREDAFFGLRRMGNVGVDMFLFLSGIGLWFSWMKNPSAKHFFIRRYLRIYPDVAHHRLSLLHSPIPRRRPRGVDQPDRRDHHQLEFLAIRRAYLLVHPSHHDALSLRPSLYGTHQAPPHLQMAAGGDDHVVHPGAICHTHSSGRRPSGNLLESSTYLLHRHQHGRDGATEADT